MSLNITAVLLGFLSVVKLATVFTFILGIIWISRRYGGKHRHARYSAVPSAEDQAILDDLGRIAEKMERRLETLEKILEADDPKWKERIQ